MDAKLIVVSGELKTGEIQLKLPTVIGRSRSADITLGHPLISRQHCEIFEADGRLMIRDMGSLNGTFVGDNRVAKEAVLEPGDLLTIGSVTFRVVIGGVARTQEAPTAEIAPTPQDEATEPLQEDRTVQAKGLASDETSQAPPAPKGKPDEGFDFSWLEEET
jgi:pSer/pThr/pTyr-binding forkhead associated (FHA) protein